MDRLGRAIEAAEDEMEAALRRTTEVWPARGCVDLPSGIQMTMLLGCRFTKASSGRRRSSFRSSRGSCRCPQQSSDGGMTISISDIVGWQWLAFGTKYMYNKPLTAHALDLKVSNPITLFPQAKERSIESLRDTLATTKRTYEGRLSQAEAALAVRDAEVGPGGGAMPPAYCSHSAGTQRSDNAR